MGAYYMASNNEYMYDFKDGHFLKLMEHSYFYNDYVGGVLREYIDNPQPLVWLCDYYSSEDKEYSPDIKTWDEISKKIIPDIEVKEMRIIFEDFYILNHTQKLFIDQRKLIKLYKAEGQKDFFIHPIPILTNSNNSAMGGGDYYCEDSRRSLWRMNIIEIKKTIPEGYVDVTEDSLFFEDEDED